MGLNDYQAQLLDLYLAWNGISAEDHIISSLQKLCAETENRIKIQMLPTLKPMKASHSTATFIPLEGRPFALLSALMNKVEATMPEVAEKDALKDIRNLFNRYRTISVLQLHVVVGQINQFYMGDRALLDELKTAQIFEENKMGKISVHKKIKALLKASKS